MRRSALLLPILLAGAAPAAAQMLPDSTYVDGFRLANGLEVRLRHVPGSVGVAVAAAFRAGRGTDPAGREGQAELLAHLFYTAPTAEHPARTLESMPQLRPLGWGLQINPRLVVAAEIGAPDQLPGILHELGSRMRGVTIEDAALTTARAEMRRQFGERHFQRADLALHYRLRELGEGLTDAQMLARASGAALDKLTAREARQRIAQLYAPANAALVLAGDLDTEHLRRMIEAEFGPIPAGTPAAEPSLPPLSAATRRTTLPSLKTPAAGIAVFAPALEDSLHPAFFLGTLVIGAWFNDQWGKPPAPFSSRFQFSLYDEPELVRFYPPAGESPQQMSAEFAQRLDTFHETSTPMAVIDQFRASVGWVLGGPLPPVIRRRAASEGGPLGTLAITTAIRTLWKGDAFWGAYARRFFETPIAPSTFSNWMMDPSRQLVLLFEPPGGSR